MASGAFYMKILFISLSVPPGCAIIIVFHSLHYSSQLLIYNYLSSAKMHYFSSLTLRVKIALFKQVLGILIIMFKKFDFLTHLGTNALVRCVLHGLSERLY